MKARLLAFCVSLSVLATSCVGPVHKREPEILRPLMIQQQGSFFVGGTVQRRDAFGAGHDVAITTGQMYVQYQVPVQATHIPVVMIHGCCLSGQSYETTPDGRMGWSEYFVRAGRSVYVVDQAARGRSGFDATDFNGVRRGVKAPQALPQILLFDRESAWTALRIGPQPGIPFPDTQFPVNAANEFYKMWIPDLNATLPQQNPTYSNLAELAQRVGGAVLIGHSQSFMFPEHAALINPASVKGIISLESGTQCSPPLPFTQQERATLARIPILVVFADHLDDAAKPFDARWAAAQAECRSFAASIRAEGGDVTFLSLPEAGIRGNTHMFMLDKNNLQIADLLLEWIDRHVERRSKKDHGSTR